MKLQISIAVPKYARSSPSRGMGVEMRKPGNCRRKRMVVPLAGVGS